ncbi:MAG: DUF362 domain-containing protein [Planctomycetes bacterium]|nr:DUF362 domain-containing protein [Planctomycetota bacterium]
MVFRKSCDDPPDRAPGNRRYVSPRGLKPAARTVTGLEKLHTRREFLAQAGVVAAGTLWPSSFGLANLDGEGVVSGARVVIARDETLTRGKLDEHRVLLNRLTNAAIQRLTGEDDAAAAWRRLFTRKSRVGIKVNTLGLSTQPPVVDAIVAGLELAGVPAENIIIWDRFDVELAHAGFKLNKSSRGVQCRGTDAEAVGSGYQSDIESSGRIGSCFSRIVAEEVDTLISVPVLKDHSLGGVSMGMKNFYGAIHNPNKYHGDNCDPYIADVVSHRFIAPKWRLTVCDAIHAQYHAGPGYHPGFAWPFGGLIVGTDFVAVDAVAADLIDAKRKEEGLPSLAADNRPAKHIMTAAARGLGITDLSAIERVGV